MGIDNLPGHGSSFSVSVGAGSFKRKFSNVVRHGSLKGLQDNKDSVIKAVKKYERAIRLGEFNRKRQIGAMGMIKAAEGSRLTKGDKANIKKIFKHLAVKSEKAVAKNIVKAKDEKETTKKLPTHRVTASVNKRVNLNDRDRLDSGLADHSIKRSVSVNQNSRINRAGQLGPDSSKTGLAHQNNTPPGSSFNNFPLSK